MGLGAPRKRAKISHDPNNTAWSRSSTKYGQRILESQGWVPGDYLGATNAPHASLHSAASASHVRIALKDDNLGLGAGRGARDNDIGTTTGLDVFHDLLGRLNGRTEKEVEKDQSIRCNMRRSAFVEQRWGALRFISGGFLVGDRLQDPVKGDSKAQGTRKEVTEGLENMVDDEREPLADGSTKTAKRRGKKERKVRCEDDVRSAELHSSGQPVSVPLEVACAAQDVDGALRRAHKAERRLKRKSRKERERELGSDGSQSLQENTLVQPQMPELVAHTVPNGNPPTRTSAVIRSRNAVRQRYIDHKKRAVMDSKALNEILMIRS